MPPRNLACSSCGREFQRTSHLRRHEKEHNSVGYPCQFCSKRFSRQDVARRHSVGCPSRQGRDMPVQTRGRKPTACNSCAHAKLSCDYRSPCQRCSARDLPCKYRCSSDDGAALAAVSGHLDRSASEGSSLSFLLHITNPEYQPVARYLTAYQSTLGRSNSGRLRTKTFCRPQELCRDGKLEAADPVEIVQGGNHRRLVRAYAPAPPNAPNLSVVVPSTLQAQLDSTFAELQSTSIVGLERYAPFFTRTAYSMFISSVSSYRQWQWSIIHWPTTCLEKISSPLLLTLALGGAALLETRGRIDITHVLDNSFYEIVETHVFDCLETAMTFYDSQKLDDQFIETCQAALLIVAIESGIANGAIKRRLLTRRLPSLVAAIRVLNTTIQSLPQSSAGSTWEDFVRRESCIRIITWTFLQDALFTLFCCRPPLFTATEMMCSLPCDDVLWEAENEKDYNIRRKRAPKEQTPSLKQAIWCLIEEDCSTNAQQDLVKMSVNHLFVLIWGVHSALFNIRSSAPAWTWSTMLQSALSRWSMCWSDAIKQVGPQQHETMDYVKLAPEIAELLGRIGDIEADGRKDTFQYFRGTHYDTHPVHELVRHFSQ